MPDTTFTSLRVKAGFTLLGTLVGAAASFTILTVTTLNTANVVVSTSYTGSGTFRSGQLNSGTGVFLNDLRATRNIEYSGTASGGALTVNGTMSGSSTVTFSKAGAQSLRGRPLCIGTGGTLNVCTSGNSPCSCVALP